MDNSGLERRLSRLQIKLSSQEGASITYALLLFLVCATVSSVILAAGTAASGRISQSVESDQRYYAVISAARLLKEQVEKYEVKIVKQKDSATTDESVPYTVFYRLKGTKGWEPYESQVSIITLDVAEYYTEAEKSPSDFPKYTMEVKVTGEDTLNVTIIEKINVKSGQIDYELKSSQGITGGGTGGNEDEPAFTMTMGFVPVIKQSTRRFEEGDGTSGGDKHTITTVTTSMSWSLMSNGVARYDTSQLESSNPDAETTNLDSNLQNGSGL